MSAVLKPRQRVPLFREPGELPPLPALLKRAAMMVQQPYEALDHIEAAAVPTGRTSPRVARYNKLLGLIVTELRGSQRLTRPRVERLVMRYYVAAVELREVLRRMAEQSPTEEISVPLPADV